MAQDRVPQQHEYQHLGAYLRDLREHFALDVAEVARRTHIRAKYIQAIEDEQLAMMPGKVYARGYVVTYAEFFGLAAEEFANQYMAQFGPAQAVLPRDDARFFVPEPKRAQIERRGVKWGYVGGAAVALMLGAYVLMPSDEAVETSGVMAVPEHLVEQLRTGMMPVARNVECIMGARALSCLDTWGEPVFAAFVEKPAMLYVERDTPLEDEEAEALTEETEATEATEDAQDEAADASLEQAPAAEVKPAAVKEPETKTPAPEKPEAKTPAEATPVAAEKTEPLPFKRQGEEDAPAGVAQDTKPTAEPKADEPAAPTAPQDAQEDTLIPSRWFEQDAPQGYQDPNAQQSNEWTPRRRR